ncbi:hypothetical protein SAMN06298226_0965 [Nitrosovibrio sp. Nv4]|nr:hypothetical protein SAMN06298226_0965 [Nitrosovibrio sp. Nv4]
MGFFRGATKITSPERTDTHEILRKLAPYFR